MKSQTVTIYPGVREITGKKAYFGNLVFRLLIIFITLFPFIYTSGKYLCAPSNFVKSFGYVEIPRSSLPEGLSQLVFYHNHPVLVINNHGTIKALSALCTINEIILQWDQDREELFCPADMARFDLNGNVKAGLAPRPLDRFRITVGEDTILIGGVYGLGSPF